MTEITTGSVVFFDAKMYVVSYCMIIVLPPDLNLPRLYIYRSYDQSDEDLTSLHHFDVVHRNFFDFSENFNLKTLKQLQNATLAVKKKKDNSAFAEVFSIELKFTVDCLKFWFQRNMKQIELDEYVGDEFIRNNLRRHTAFVIFQLKVGQRMDGLIMSVKQNICFWEIFFRQKKCTE